jgi:ATP phosphoribosyltransferase regulatory subunit
MDKYKLPIGTRDYLPEESYYKNVITSDIMDVFRSHNYLRVETPAMEYYNLYSQGGDRVREEDLFKLTDTDGRILVLRPDITLPVSRMVCTKVKPNGVLKYCYLGNCYNLNTDGKYRLREFTQAGIELINDSSPYADADVIAIAIEALLAAGLEDFLIDIGQVEFFKGIIDSLGFRGKEKAGIAELIYKKDIIGINELIKNNEKKIGGYTLAGRSSQLELLTKLPTLFGGIEVCEKAESYSLNDDCLEVLDCLRQLYEILDVRGMSKYLSFDLSLVNAMNYYSGIVFKGITGHFGTPILAGGRYDGLSSVFNADIPSTGFAIGIDNLMTALERAGKTPELPVVDYVIGYDPIGYEQAIKAADKLREEGYIVDSILTDSQESLIKYQKAKSIKCKKMIFIGNKEAGGVTKE